MIKQQLDSHKIAPYLHVLEMVPRGILLVDQTGKLSGLNSRAIEQLGYSRETARNKSIFEINPHYSILSWKKIWKKLGQEKKLSEETEFMTQQGIIYPVRLELIPLETPDVSLCCILIENLLETNRYKDLLELTSQISRVGSWEWDLVNQSLILTNEVYELIGQQVPERGTDGQRFREILRKQLSPQDTRKLLRAVRASLSEGQAFDEEITFIHDDGSKVQLNVIGQPMVAEDQAPKVFGIIQDISNISQRSEEMYMSQFALDHIRDMILWVRNDGSIFYANQAVQSLTEKPMGLLNNVKVPELFPKTGMDSWSELWQELQTQKMLEFETEMLDADGNVLPVLVAHNYLVFQGQEFDCLIIRNILLKKERDELIHMVHHTLNQSNEFIFWIREDASFLYYNEAVAERLGYSAEEVSKLTLYDINLDLTQDDFRDFWEQTVSDGVLEAEHNIYTKSGLPIPVEASVTYVDYSGQECCCIIMRDVSLRKRREKELELAFSEIQELKNKLEEEKTYLREEVASAYNFNNIISRSEHYQHVLQLVAQVADTDSTVLITGETGTGKELLARAVHGLSQRDERSLVKVNCAALPENLIESELFGHEKGAFTGAYEKKIGKFELADKGTIFLDEIGEMPLELQSKLLRVLQEGEFERLGSPLTHNTDVRVIAATNRNLEQMVNDGRFRQDLFYRLNVFPIHNLPLRERKEDIPLLVEHFLKKFNDKAGKRIDRVLERALEKLSSYEFPGNIRELENIIERAVIVTNGEVLQLEDVLPKQKEGLAAANHFPSFEEIQRQHILDALKRCHGKISGTGGAAELLKMNDKTLYSKMRKFDIQRHDYANLR